MPQKLPQVSGRNVVKLLEGLGYVMVRQRGSHVRLRKAMKTGTRNITVPLHKTIAKGTLNDILSKVSLWNDIPKEDLIEKLK